MVCAVQVLMARNSAVGRGLAVVGRAGDLCVPCRDDPASSSRMTRRSSGVPMRGQTRAGSLGPCAPSDRFRAASAPSRRTRRDRVYAAGVVVFIARRRSRRRARGSPPRPDARDRRRLRRRAVLPQPRAAAPCSWRCCLLFGASDRRRLLPRRRVRAVHRRVPGGVGRSAPTSSRPACGTWRCRCAALGVAAVAAAGSEELDLVAGILFSMPAHPRRCRSSERARCCRARARRGARGADAPPRGPARGPGAGGRRRRARAHRPRAARRGRPRGVSEMVVQAGAARRAVAAAGPTDDAREAIAAHRGHRARGAGRDAPPARRAAPRRRVPRAGAPADAWRGSTALVERRCARRGAGRPVGRGRRRDAACRARRRRLPGRAGGAGERVVAAGSPPPPTCSCATAGGRWSSRSSTRARRSGAPAPSPRTRAPRDARARRAVRRRRCRRGRAARAATRCARACRWRAAA